MDDEKTNGDFIAANAIITSRRYSAIVCEVENHGSFVNESATVFNHHAESHAITLQICPSQQRRAADGVAIDQGQMMDLNKAGLSSV
jgi:hypothetical protein